MFAVLQASPEVSLDGLVEVAQAFSPRVQVIGPFVLLDVSGLSALFGSASELGASLQAASPACRSIAVAATATAALLLAAAGEGLTVVHAAQTRATLAALPLEVLVEVAEARLPADEWPAGPRPVTDLPPAKAGAAPGVGWRHPRDTHQAGHLRRPRGRRVVEGPRRQALAAIARTAATVRRWGIRTLGALAALPGAEVHERLGEIGTAWQRLARGEDDQPLVPWQADPVFEASLDLEWPIEGFEPLSFVLARLFEPLSAELERADRGALAIRTALHLTTRAVHLRVLPLPAPMRDPKTLRTLVLLDLESHPPGAAIDRVQIRLEPTPGRVLQWTLFDPAQPAPELVATLVARLTALVGESHVGSPALVDSWRPGAFAMTPFQPGATPAPAPIELTRSRAGAGAGEAAPNANAAAGLPDLTPADTTDCAMALRRFRLPVPVRVRVDEGRPVHVMTDRHGITGGAIVQAAGPWRTSGEWWQAGVLDPGSGSGTGRESSGPGAAVALGLAPGEPGPGSSATRASGSDAERPSLASRRPATGSQPWDRDEWDVALADGTVYRVSVERSVGQWMLEGVFD